MASMIYGRGGRQSLNVRCVFLDDSSLERAGNYTNSKLLHARSVRTLPTLPSDQSLCPGDRQPVGTLLSHTLVAPRGPAQLSSLSNYQQVPPCVPAPHLQANNVGLSF